MKIGVIVAMESELGMLLREMETVSETELNGRKYYNGHIGYEVDEGARGHGYARRACALVLDVARFHGMKRLYLTCAEDNAASYRTIEKLGGRLLEICGMPRDYFAWYEGIPRHRIYQLDL